jgi:hypothetical protein
LVQDFLSKDSAGRWILVFDNADDIQMWTDVAGSETQHSKRLIDYIPWSKNGQVIFTSRDRKAGVKLAQQNVIEVLKMSEDSAMRMLRNCLIDKPLVDARSADAKAVLAWLTHLPLAIVQASAYINENSIALAEYLTLLDCQEQEVIDLLTEQFEVVQDIPT